MTIVANLQNCLSRFEFPLTSVELLKIFWILSHMRKYSSIAEWCPRFTKLIPNSWGFFQKKCKRIPVIWHGIGQESTPLLCETRPLEKIATETFFYLALTQALAWSGEKKIKSVPDCLSYRFANGSDTAMQETVYPLLKVHFSLIEHFVSRSILAILYRILPLKITNVIYTVGNQVLPDTLRCTCVNVLYLSLWVYFLSWKLGDQS